MPGGRPSKFQKEYMERIKLMATAGLTDEDMAVCLGVTEQTFNNWKKKYPEFFESLKDWKLVADEKVERSLFERATGYSAIETKLASDKGQFTDREDVVKQYPPDPTAAIFWLKNRQPDKWRDKQEIKHEGSLTVKTENMTDAEIEKRIKELTEKES